jgi:metallo-beta-lactamase class B
MPANMAIVAPPPSQWTSQCKDSDEWEKAGPPYRIHGDTYYVGTCGIAAILVASSDGHILIDTGTEAGADVVKANIEKLGFKIEDVAILLTSHEHFDHVGGIAKMRNWSGGEIWTSGPATNVLRSGKDSPDDPQFGLHPPMAPAAVARAIADGEKVERGATRLTAIATPGHTPGALSWSWESCEGKDCLTIVYADSLNPISNDIYRFSDHPEYLAAFRQGIERLAQADCDLLLTPHPSASAMPRRLASGGLRDAGACRAYAAAIMERLEKRLQKETESARPDG